MEKEKIGIDIDEVVVEFMAGYLKFHNLHHNTNYKLEDITNYHLWKSGFHKTKGESVKDVTKFSDSVYFDSLVFVNGAKQGLSSLLESYKTYFITSRSDRLKEKTLSFFNSNFSKNGYKIVFSGEIYGGKVKWEICKDLGISLLIEDNPDYALNCAKKGIKVFLFDKPWNKNYEKHENIVKVRDWDEIMEKLK